MRRKTNLNSNEHDLPVQTPLLTLRRKVVVELTAQDNDALDLG